MSKIPSKFSPFKWFAGIFFLLHALAWGQKIPEPTDRQNLIHDFAKVLPKAQVERLNKQMQNWQMQNGAEVVVVVMPSIEGAEIAMYTTELAEQWDIGKADEDNGVCLLVALKEKRVHIATGYGIEGIIPDALAKRIIETAITPKFKQGDLMGGIEAGVIGIQKLITGEFGPEQFRSRGGKSNAWFILPLIFLALLIISRRNKGGGPQSRGGTYWIGGMGTGGFGSSGGFGGSSGGFGGFGGGGSFGGGGASGSW